MDICESYSYKWGLGTMNVVNIIYVERTTGVLKNISFGHSITDSSVVRHLFDHSYTLLYGMIWAEPWDNINKNIISTILLPIKGDLHNKSLTKVERNNNSALSLIHGKADITGNNAVKLLAGDLTDYLETKFRTLIENYLKAFRKYFRYYN